MSKNKVSRAIRRRYQDVVSVGCIICRLYYGVRSDPCIHHLTGSGMGKRSEQVIGLCHEHHQGNTGVHHNTKVFEEKFGTQEYLLEEMNKLIAK
tara:strand:- start:152 stop:433 length:282 start_codon:yes stop_codon:yes gene_type:complete